MAARLLPKRHRWLRWLRDGLHKLSRDGFVCLLRCLAPRFEGCEGFRARHTCEEGKARSSFAAIDTMTHAYSPEKPSQPSQFIFNALKQITKTLAHTLAKPSKPS